MQRGKILVAILAILLVGVAVPSTLPKGHADDSTQTLTASGYTLRPAYDPYYGETVNAITMGSTLTFTLYWVASNTGNFQRNITMGVKFDWMQNYQNTTSSTPIAMGQSAYVILTYTIPTTSTLNLTPHSWTVEVWDLNTGGVWTNANCYPYYTYEIGNTSCRQFTSSYQIAIYSNAQASAVLTEQQASAEVSAIGGILGGTKQAPPGTSAAVADLAAAEVQLNLGNNAYQTGNFNQAQTDYQNALNDANAAQSSLATTGGGTDTATMTSIWLGAVAVLLGGIGAVMVGFGGFNFLRHKSKTLSTNTPSSTPK